MPSNGNFAPPPVNRHMQRGMIPVKPKHFGGTLLRLWRLTRGHRQGLVAVFLLSAAASLTAMFTPYLIGRAIDSIQSGSLLLPLLLALAGVYVGDCAVRFFQGYVMAGVSQRIVQFLRKALFDVLNHLPLSTFDRSQHGDFMSRLTNDIDNISTTISDSLAQLMLLVCTLTGVLAMMLSLSPPLTLAALITSPLVFLLAKCITRRTRVLFKSQQAALGRLNGHIEETISGLMVVKAFCREQEAMAEFEDVNDRLTQVGARALIWSGFLMPITNVINNLCFISVSVTGGVLAALGMITVGVISTFVLYARQFTRPLNEIANIYNTLQTAVAGAERVFEIFDEAPEPPDRPDAQPLESCRGDIVLEDVRFCYDPGHPILRGLSLHIPPGARVAIVGSTGAGKTTIMSLLVRFYDVTGGRILLDGRDIRDYKRQDLRRQFGIVLQDTALFHLSILENIRYGCPDASDEAVVAAARAAHADGFIQRLPEGYHTLVGEGGGTLSQGERQLITIARAMLANAPILILDEATSSVDTRTEAHIRDAIHTMTEGRTSFFIAHRLSTIRDCDIIVVLEDGVIQEVGDHQTLLARRGRYYDLYTAQTGGKIPQEDA
jgi:ATP-binding cassette subfamily B multidrug efflux pump